MSASTTRVAARTAARGAACFAARTLATIALALAGIILPGVGAAAADSGGVGITVTVSPVPSDVAVPVAVPGSVPGSGWGLPGTGNTGVPGSSASGTPSGGSGSTVVTGGTKASAPVPTADEFDLGGIVFVSGVTSGYGWSIDPLGGESHAEFTVHNVSGFTIDGSAGFQLVGPFGNEIARVDGIAIDELKPDESRVVEATLRGLGQWTFFTTHATFTPPESVGGTMLTSITRDGFMFVLPWVLLVLLILAAGAYRVVAIIRDSPTGGASAPVGGDSAPVGGGSAPVGGGSAPVAGAPRPVVGAPAPETSAVGGAVA